MALAEIDGAGITGREQFILASDAPIPDRADRVDHMPGGQPVAGSDLGAAGFAAMKGAAFLEQLRSCGAMDRAIDPAAAEKRRIRRVDDGINAQGRDIGDDDFEPYLANPARDQVQAMVEAGTPLSANSCCSSPAWNISRMMSQPPTNSPLT